MAKCCYSRGFPVFSGTNFPVSRLRRKVQEECVCPSFILVRFSELSARAMRSSQLLLSGTIVFLGVLRSRSNFPSLWTLSILKILENHCDVSQTFPFESIFFRMALILGSIVFQSKLLTTSSMRLSQYSKAVLTLVSKHCSILRSSLSSFHSVCCYICWCPIFQFLLLSTQSSQNKATTWFFDGMYCNVW